MYVCMYKIMWFTICCSRRLSNSATASRDCDDDDDDDPDRKSLCQEKNSLSEVVDMDTGHIATHQNYTYIH